MRQNVPLQDLSDRFDVHRSSASRIFLDMTHYVMKLSPLVYWPDHEQLQETTPMCFRANYGTTVSVIIDCFELFIERPSSLRVSSIFHLILIELKNYLVLDNRFALQVIVKALGSVLQTRFISDAVIRPARNLNHKGFLL